MSLRVKEIAFSCYAVTDMDRAKAFYGGLLGLKECFDVTSPDGSSRWVEYDVGGAALSLGRTADWKPSPDGCAVALEVEDFDAAIAHLRAGGAKITMEPLDTGVCRMAGLADPDGNPLFIHRRHPAKPL